KDGAYETPSAAGELSFRYIVIDNIPPANGRIATNNGNGYNIDELKQMSYSEVALLLGVH
ncbi:MAG: hypothetical protein ICV51_20980, partial [Flavisolibacter sp.]|nr:hypothetical protein [Flavisolibacter sp.]